MATTEALITAEEFGRMELEGPFELVRGKLVMMNVPYPQHGYYCARLARILGNHVEQHDLGRVLTNDSGVVTERSPDSVRGADVAYYSYQRLPKGPIPKGYLAVVPELVFEVRSPSDRWKEIEAKVAEYLAAGVTAVGVFDVDAETFHLFEAGAIPRILGPNDELRFPSLLGDFRVSIATLLE